MTDAKVFKWITEQFADAKILRYKVPGFENLPLKPKQTIEDFINEITPVIFNPELAPKRVNQKPEMDMIISSASNFYEGVTQKEAEGFYDNLRKNAGETGQDTLVAFGLNSKLVKENGKVVEKTYQIGGLYSRAIEKIVFWLNKAINVAENPEQRAVISKLIEYYRTGDFTTQMLRYSKNFSFLPAR
jgi:dipeptidyl-peptidase-3